MLGLRINPDQQGILRAATGLDLDNAHPTRSQSAHLGILRQLRAHDRRIERFRLEQVTALRGDQQVGLARLQRDQVGVGRGNRVEPDLDSDQQRDGQEDPERAGGRAERGAGRSCGRRIRARRS